MAIVTEGIPATRRTGISADTLLRFIAVLLVVNSHFDTIYPKWLTFFVQGGAIGNSIFFFCSGYALYYSEKPSFVKWIWRRVTRIYPSLWLYMLATGIIGLESWSAVDVIIPKFWFLSAILVFYPILFVISKYWSKWLTTILVLSVICMAANFFLFNDINSWIIRNTHNPTYLHWMTYFPIMILGAYAAKNGASEIKTAREKIISVSLLAVFAALYFLSVPLTRKYCLPLQIIVPTLMIPLSYYMMRVASIVAAIKSPDISKRFILQVSTLTLDIYIVHYVFIRIFSAWQFPQNFFAASVCIYMAAWVMWKVSTKASNLLRKLV